MRAKTVNLLEERRRKSRGESIVGIRVEKIDEGEVR